MNILDFWFMIMGKEKYIVNVFLRPVLFEITPDNLDKIVSLYGRSGQSNCKKILNGQCVACSAKAKYFIICKTSPRARKGLFTQDFVPMTVDHIIPKSKGGTDKQRNKQVMCYTCNAEKGNRIIQ